MMLSLQGIDLRPPTEDEFALLTTLRNRNRRWFADQRELEHGSASAWLATRHDDDRVLCVVTAGMIVGTVGWSRVPTSGRIYELGRTIGDYRAAREAGCDAGRLHRAARLAVYQALDHLFGTLHADAVYVRIRPGNGLVRKVVEDFEGRSGVWPFPDSDGNLDSWQTSPADWYANRDRILARINAHAGEAATTRAATSRR